MIQRTRKMTFRLSEEEYEIIKGKVKESGISQQQFLLKTALEKEVIHIKEFQTLIFHIKKIGININQITRHCNETGNVTEAEISEVRKGMEKIWQLLKQSKIHIQT
jgi:Bacterial mobilisation protein (MobC).